MELLLRQVPAAFPLLFFLHPEHAFQMSTTIALLLIADETQHFPILFSTNIAAPCETINGIVLKDCDA